MPDETSARELAAFAGTFAPDVLLVVDADGVVRWVSASVVEVLGWKPEDLIGREVEVLVPDVQRARHRHLRAGFADRDGSRTMGEGIQLTAQPRSGDPIPVDIALTSAVRDGSPMVLVAVRDLRERVAMEAELGEVRARLQRTAERSRIARDLHDTVSQELYGLGLGLERARRRGAAAEDDIVGFIGQLDSAIRQLATAIFELRDPVAEDVGADIHQTVRRSARALGFPAEVTIEGDPTRIGDGPTARNLLLALRELLSNVARHAEAGWASVRVEVAEDVCVTVTDDGVGGVTEDRFGSGLTGVADRARECGGTFTVAPSPSGRGLRATWTVPLRRGRSPGRG